MKHKKRKSPKQAPKVMQNTRVIILLDRTGSMISEKRETIGGFNGYLDGLTGTDITVKAVQFDSISRDTIFEFTAPKAATRLNDKNYEPRANTPLYDAIGQTIRDIRESCKGDKVMFVVLTDGQENASSEFNLSSVKALIRECEDRDKWTFAYIGMGIDGWGATQSLAAGTQSANNVKLVSKSGKGAMASYRSLSRATVNYCADKSGQCVTSAFAGDPDTE